MSGSKVANAREFVEPEKCRSFFCKIFNDFHHAKKGAGSEKASPTGIFCLSSVAHVDDDTDAHIQTQNQTQNQNQTHNHNYNHNQTHSHNHNQTQTQTHNHNYNHNPHSHSHGQEARSERSSLVSKDNSLAMEESKRSLLPNGDVSENRGKYTWPNGSSYEGQWFQGKRNGKGKMCWASGASYEGDFMAGDMHGIGTYVGSDRSVYTGGWQFHKKHGFGEQRYANGDRYKGFWQLGSREGNGKYTWKNGSEYEGDWKSGVMNGRGKITWQSGEKYEGQLQDGRFHGYGVFTWADGSKYKGTWSKGLKDGKGTLYPSEKRSHTSFGAVMDDKDGVSRRLQGKDDTNIGRFLGLKDGKGTLYPQEKKLHTTFGAMVGDKDGISRRPEGKDDTNIGRFLCIAANGLFFHSPGHRRRSSDGAFVEKILGGEIPSDIRERCGRKYAPDNWDPEDLDGRNMMESTSGLDGDSRRRPIVVREYVQGVLLREFIKPCQASSRWKPCMSETKELPKRPGENIIKGHRSYDLMLNLQLGIRYTVGKITPAQKQDLCEANFGPRARVVISFPREGSQLTPPHQSIDFKFTDYCPTVFRHLRELFKIDAADYMLSLCGNEGLRELSSPGKSGSIFYLSHDDRFMIKTMRKTEIKVLLRMLPNYYNHVCREENTLVTKFFGLHCIKSAGGHKVRFVVMGNVLCTELRIHQRFDLKGSSQGRSTNKVEIDDTTTFKDLDLNFEFGLASSWRDALLAQISRDCQFLESEGIMDYSLLLGVHFRAPKCSTPRLADDLVLHENPSIGTVLAEDKVSEKLVLVNHEPENDCATPGSHVRGSPLRAPLPANGEVDLLLPGTARLTVRLGVNMPAQAYHRPCRAENNGSELDTDVFGGVCDIVLYFGIIDILQEYDMGKRLEHAYKSMQFNPRSISAVDPAEYSKRIQDFICQIFPQGDRGKN